MGNYLINADGPPIDFDGTVSVDHLAIKLSKEQLERVGYSRILKLEKEQLALIRKINPDFPEIIRVITPSFEDCPCNNGIYGIWNKKSQVCIAINQITRDKKHAEKNLLNNKIDDLTKNTAYLYMDSNADIYLNQKKITLEKLNEIMKKLTTVQDGAKFIFINMPPKIDKETNEKIINILKDLKEKGKQLDVKIYETG